MAQEAEIFFFGCKSFKIKISPILLLNVMLFEDHFYNVAALPT